MSPQLGTHPLAAPTYAGWLHPRLSSAALPVPPDSSGTLQRSIAEDIEPSLGHGRDLLLLGCGQVLQEAGSARQGWTLARRKAGMATMGTTGKPHHATLHSQPRSTETPCTGHTASGTQRIQPSPSPAERPMMPPQLGDRDATAPREPEACAVRVPPSPVGPNGPGAHCDPCPKAAKPRRAPGKRLVGTLLLLMPCVARAQTPLARPLAQGSACLETHACLYLLKLPQNRLVPMQGGGILPPEGKQGSAPTASSPPGLVPPAHTCLAALQRGTLAPPSPHGPGVHGELGEPQRVLSCLGTTWQWVLARQGTVSPPPEPPSLPPE